MRQEDPLFVIRMEALSCLIAKLWKEVFFLVVASEVERRIG